MPRTESFAFRNRRPYGADHFKGIGFQPTRFELTTDRFALQLYGEFQPTRFELTTDRFALQLYGEFN